MCEVRLRAKWQGSPLESEARRRLCLGDALVVRDGFAAFYFHPFLDLDYLKCTVEGIEAAGHGFVDPASL